MFRWRNPSSIFSDRPHDEGPGENATEEKKFDHPQCYQVRSLNRRTLGGRCGEPVNTARTAEPIAPANQ